MNLKKLQQNVKEYIINSLNNRSFSNVFVSKALEYAKVQVKLKPKGSNKTYMHEDSNERHKVNNHEARQHHDYDESSISI